MSGLPELNRPVFNDVEQMLREQGFTVLNPAALPDGLAHEQYMDITLAMLAQADAIYMLTGWQDSKGAVIEYEQARSVGLSIIYESWDALKSAVSSDSPAAPYRGIAVGVRAMMAHYQALLDQSCQELCEISVDECTDALHYCETYLAHLCAMGGNHVAGC
jgi:hypothetical protein